MFLHVYIIAMDVCEIEFIFSHVENVLSFIFIQIFFQELIAITTRWCEKE